MGPREIEQSVLFGFLLFLLFLFFCFLADLWGEGEWEYSTMTARARPGPENGIPVKACRCL